MANEKTMLSIHHIGGRAGNHPFPILPEVFEKSIERVLYEADESCISQIRERTRHLPSRLVILPYCIAGHTGKAPFYIRADRYSSSLLPSPPQESFRADFDFGWDMDLTHHVDEVCTLDVQSLDNLYSQESVSAAAPDFLSLDVEGAEPQLLSGAERLLRHHILAVQCEFDLNATFSDLRTIFAQHSFQLVETQMVKTGFCTDKQMSIGVRGVQGQGTIGELIGLKTPAAIVKEHDHPQRDLLKAAFIALVLFKFQEMYAYLDAWKKLDGARDYLEKTKPQQSYLQFLSGFIGTLETYPPIFPLRFSSLLPTVALRRERFGESYTPLTACDYRKNYFTYVDQALFKKLATVLVSENYIGIEKSCVDNGFEAHAELIKKFRLDDMCNLLVRLDFAKMDGCQLVINLAALNDL